MRIVHISDIHLSDKNFEEFETFYLEDLLETLAKENQAVKIDVIVITGDLVDQGGHSLRSLKKFEGFSDPFKFFEEEFIKPIKERISLSNSRFLFVPGNHDVDENEILWHVEKKLKNQVSENSINKYLDENLLVVNQNNERLKLFKNFEKEFHKDTKDYEPSNNQSTYIYKTKDDLKVGFALINDSWRCSTCHLHGEDKNHLYFGARQLIDALKVLEDKKTVMNICLTHHSTANYAEVTEIDRILIRKQYHLHLFGHSHHHQYMPKITPNGECFGIMARSALNKHKEINSKWQPGFQIIDIDLNVAAITKMIYYRYIHSSGGFGCDSEIARPDGIDNRQYPLGFEPSVSTKDLSNLDITKYNVL